MTPVIKARSFSLRQMLTIPYVALVLVAACVIGALSYYTGRDAVNTLSDYLLKETVGRISQAVQKHVSGSEAVLETAFPSGVFAPASVPQELENLRTRFWLATSVHRDPNNYAYYGDRDGHFFGLWRFSENEAELRLRSNPNSPRKIYHFKGIRGALDAPRTEEQLYDPRERPWYKAGQSNSLQTWTSIYIDFKTLELVGTRARRVNDAEGNFRGVVATDLSLEHLNGFLRQLKLSPNGFAFIVEQDGNLIATSRGPHLKKGVGQNNQRLNAEASDDPLIVASYHEVRAQMGKVGRTTEASAIAGVQTAAQTTVFDGPNGESVQVGYARVRDAAGLDWVVAVGVPRSDFLSGITTNVKRTIIMALIASLLIIVTGFLVLGTVTKDLRTLAQAARDVGDGVISAPLKVERKDEIGELAQTFATMQQRLLTDRLTGIANREAFIRHIEEKIIKRRRAADVRPFALMFIDLNRFKNINDTYGHDVGDQVLIEMSERMRSSLRASDFLARYAGDEFVVLISDIDNRQTAERVRQHMEEKLTQPVKIRDDDMSNIGTSLESAGAAIGIACYPEDGQDVESLVKFADAEMYQRKKQELV